MSDRITVGLSEPQGTYPEIRETGGRFTGLTCIRLRNLHPLGETEMLLNPFKQMVRALRPRRGKPVRKKPQRKPFVPGMESLAERIAPAVFGIFIPGTGLLSVFGDNLDNTITISRDAAGKILVNGGAVNIIGGTATVANTATIQVFGQGGNDTITLNEASGALPRALLFGGA